MNDLFKLIFYLAMLGLLVVVGERALGNVRTVITRQIQRV